MASPSEESQQPQSSLDVPVSLWRNRSYLLLAGGQAISEMGTQVSDLAYILLILALTRSPAQVGLVGMVELLPVLFLSLHAGALVDHWDRKRVMMFCDTGRALCLASIVVALALGRLTMVQIYLVAGAESTLSVFFDLAERACLRNIVSREQLPEASAQNQSITYTAALVGPAVSGALYSVGQAFPFLTDALSYLASVLSLLWIKVPFQQQRQPASRALWGDIKEGFLWLKSQPLLRFMTLMIGGLNLTAVGMSLIVVILAQQQHASAFAIGLILAIGSVGGIVGGMLGPFFVKRFRYGQVISLVVRGSLPIGIALTGFLLQRFGGVLTVLIFAVYRLFLALIVTLNPHVRHAPALSELQASS